MVAVLAGQAAYVQRGAAGVDKGLEKVIHQLGVEAADALGGDRQVERQVGAARQVQHLRRVRGRVGGQGGFEEIPVDLAKQLRKGPGTAVVRNIRRD